MICTSRHAHLKYLQDNGVDKLCLLGGACPGDVDEGGQ